HGLPDGAQYCWPGHRPTTQTTPATQTAGRPWSAPLPHGHERYPSSPPPAPTRRLPTPPSRPNPHTRSDQDPSDEAPPDTRVLPRGHSPTTAPAPARSPTATNPHRELLWCQWF